MHLNSLLLVLDFSTYNFAAHIKDTKLALRVLRSLNILGKCMNEDMIKFPGFNILVTLNTKLVLNFLYYCI